MNTFFILLLFFKCHFPPRLFISLFLFTFYYSSSFSSFASSISRSSSIILNSHSCLRIYSLFLLLKGFNLNFLLVIIIVLFLFFSFFPVIFISTVIPSTVGVLLFTFLKLHDYSTQHYFCLRLSYATCTRMRNLQFSFHNRRLLKGNHTKCWALLPLEILPCLY